MLSGRIPGNRNLDNVEPVLEANKNLLYTRTTLDVGPLKAVVVTSFGFGQAGGELVLIHPDYFLATYSTDDLQVYQSKRDARWKDSNKFHEDVVAGRRSYVEVKTTTPYPPVDVKPISNQCFTNETFLARNYTKQERTECGTTARSYAGLWGGKEAVVKVLGNAGAKLKSAG